MANEPLTNSSKSAPSAPERLEQVRRQLAAERRSIQRAATLSLIVGVVLLCLLSGYFAYGYSQVKELQEPEKLVDLLEDKLQQQLPEARKKLQEDITSNAPKWAADLSKYGLENLPTARKQMEEYALTQYEATVKEVSALTDEQFRNYLRGHRPMLDKHFKELETSPQLADASLAELEASLEEQLARDMKAEAREILDTLISLNDSLRALKADQKLTPEEQSSRRIVMLVRHLELKQNDPARLKQFAQPLPAKAGHKVVAKKPMPPTMAKDKGKATQSPAPTGKDKASPDKKGADSKPSKDK